MKEKNGGIYSRSILKDLSQSRTFLMGFAILSVVMFHVRARSYCPEWPWAMFLNKVISAGHGGCDIFLFLSGFGLAHSLAKDSRIPQYLKRRAQKLFPAYYPFILLYIACVAMIRGITVKEAFGNLAFLGMWFEWGNQFNWYIQTAVAFYLLAPVFYWLVRKLGGGAKSLMVLIAISGLLQVAFYGKYQMIAITRVPVFALGFYLGTCDKEKLRWTKGYLAASALAFIFGMWFWNVTQPHVTWGNGLYWYPFLLLAPSLCLLVAAVRPSWLKIGILRKLDSMVCLCGTCSLEIYLIHLLFFETLFIHVQNNRFWLIMVAVCIALGIGYHYLVEYAMNRFHKTKGR